MNNIHASCIKYNGKGILFIGDSGSGKSDLCFRMIMQKKAVLVADDRVDLEVKSGKIYANCPKAIEGLIEIRCIGIKTFDFDPKVKIDLVIELSKDLESLDRMPEVEFFEFNGAKVPQHKLYPFEASILDKIELLAS